MREFFQEKFQLPVEFFNPLRNVAVGGGQNIEEIGHSAHRMGELVGLALRGTSDCPMELNLRPARVVRRHQLSRRRPFLIMAGLCALLALTGWWLYFQQAAQATADASKKLTPKVAELQNYDKLINAARKEIQAQQDTAAPLLTAVDERNYWVRIIDDIGSRLPKDYVWVTSFDVKAPGKAGPGETETPAQAAAKKSGPGGGRRAAGGTVLSLKGLYLWNDRQTAVVDDFVTKLGESTLYTVDKDNLKRSVPNDQEWAYEFEIPLVLQNPISLPSFSDK
jgi:type IV pilus assembly protein PilM